MLLVCDLFKVEKNLGKNLRLKMFDLFWKLKKGDLVKIFSSEYACVGSYGLVVSKEPYSGQLPLFPTVMVFSLSDGCARQYYPYNLEIVSPAA